MLVIQVDGQFYQTKVVLFKFFETYLLIDIYNGNKIKIDANLIDSICIEYVKVFNKTFTICWISVVALLCLFPPDPAFSLKVAGVIVANFLFLIAAIYRRRSKERIIISINIAERKIKFKQSMFPDTRMASTEANDIIRKFSVWSEENNISFLGPRGGSE